jgi:hypothetical protein
LSILGRSKDKLLPCLFPHPAPPSLDHINRQTSFPLSGQSMWDRSTILICEREVQLPVGQSCQGYGVAGHHLWEFMRWL